MERRIKVGLCGFSIAQASYAHHYPVVEIQHTFYEPPPDATLVKWRTNLPPPFEFTLKAWQLITHTGTSSTYRKLKQPLTSEEQAQAGAFRDSAVVERGWQRTLECARLLDATAILFQCPASFRPTPENVRNLRVFFNRIVRPRGVRLMWEPRGEWAEPTVKGLCTELGLVHVVDPFVNRPLTTHPTYLRLHGLGGARHVYSDDELAQLHAALPPSGEIYVMFNNIPRPADSRRFQKLLAQHGEG